MQVALYYFNMAWFSVSGELALLEKSMVTHGDHLNTKVLQIADLFPNRRDLNC